MIIVFSSGQLGNQIFQYKFCESLRNKNERILTSKCEYFDVFVCEEAQYIFVGRVYRFLLRRLLALLSLVRVVSSVKQDQVADGEFSSFGPSYSTVPGLFRSIQVVYGFFQSDKFDLGGGEIKSTYSTRAHSFMNELPENSVKAFIHVRRGDYTDWSIMGVRDASLPLEYYKQRMLSLCKLYSDITFIVLGDDLGFIEENFGFIDNVVISRESAAVDLAIMGLCDVAVLSNSTLSWWGVKLSRKNIDIFAPKYWLGWKSNKWYPIGIQIDGANYVDLKCISGCRRYFDKA